MMLTEGVAEVGTWAEPLLLADVLVMAHDNNDISPAKRTP